MLRRILNYFRGERENSEDSIERKKREFYENFPENPVTLPNDGPREPSSEESPQSVQENVKINKPTEFLQGRVDTLNSDNPG